MRPFLLERLLPAESRTPRAPRKGLFPQLCSWCLNQTVGVFYPFQTGRGSRNSEVGTGSLPVEVEAHGPAMSRDPVMAITAVLVVTPENTVPAHLGFSVFEGATQVATLFDRNPISASRHFAWEIGQ